MERPLGKGFMKKSKTKQYFFSAGRGGSDQKIERLKKTIIDSTNQPYYVNLWMGNFQRRVGQQIAPWSCVPTCYEVAENLWFGNKGSRQEWMGDRDKWLNNGECTLHLMPYDKKSNLKVRKDLGIKLIKTLKGKQVTLKNLTKPRGLTHYAWVISFTKFGMPGKTPTSGHSHACIPISIDGHVDIFVPSYNRNKKIKGKMIYRYKSWEDVLAIQPSVARLIVPK